MKIEDSFRVEVPVEEAWKVLLDLERIAPCLPGAQLTEVEGDEYRGTVKIKVGPITAQYKGVAKIEEADEANRKVVLQAEGRDTRGQGNASATVIATLVGRRRRHHREHRHRPQHHRQGGPVRPGVMADVSSKLLGQFADNLKQDVLSGAEPADAASAAPGSAVDGADGAVRDSGASAVDAGFASTGARQAPARARSNRRKPRPSTSWTRLAARWAKRIAPDRGRCWSSLLALRSILKRRKRKKQQVRHPDELTPRRIEPVFDPAEASERWSWASTRASRAAATAWCARDGGSSGPSPTA